MSFFASLLALVLLARHLRLYRRFPSLRQVVAYFVAVAGVSAFWTGFYLSVKEDARSRYGHLTSGTIVEKMSSTGEQGTRTIGWRHAVIRTSKGTRYYEHLARQIITGSPLAWAVDYSYDCGRPQPCWGRDFVSRDAWMELRKGARVEVRHVPDGIGGQRLEQNPQWATAIVEMCIGGVVLLVACALFRFRPPLTRQSQAIELQSH